MKIHIVQVTLAHWDEGVKHTHADTWKDRTGKLTNLPLAVAPAPATQPPCMQRNIRLGSVTQRE